MQVTAIQTPPFRQSLQVTYAAFIHHSPTYLNGLFSAASLFRAFSTIVACHKATLL